MHDELGVRVGLSTHGWGVFSLRSFRPEELVGPIEGTIVQDEDYESDYCMELGVDLSLEPSAPFRFLNHSCQPNCALIEFEVEYGQDRKPELWVEVKSDIALGDQLTIDYGWPAHSPTPCTCGAPGCRGWIVAAEQVGEIGCEADSDRKPAG